jgi:hypothetical protein
MFGIGNIDLQDSLVHRLRTLNDVRAAINELEQGVSSAFSTIYPLCLRDWDRSDRISFHERLLSLDGPEYLFVLEED